MTHAILPTDIDDRDFIRSFPDDADRVGRLPQPLQPDRDLMTCAARDGIPAEDIGAAGISGKGARKPHAGMNM